MAKYVNAGKESEDGIERQEVSDFKQLFQLYLGVTIRWLTNLYIFTQERTGERQESTSLIVHESLKNMYQYCASYGHAVQRSNNYHWIIYLTIVHSC